MRFQLQEDAKSLLEWVVTETFEQVQGQVNLVTYEECGLRMNLSEQCGGGKTQSWGTSRHAPGTNPKDP